MKTMFFAFMTTLTFGFCAMASEETTIDLAKFATKAHNEILAAFGPYSFENQYTQILFQDAALLKDAESAIDLASLNYVVQVKPYLLPLENLLVSYRLKLGGGQADLKFAAVAKSIHFYSADSGMSVFTDDTTVQQLLDLQNELKKIAPEIDLVIHSSIGIINFSCSPKNISKVMSAMTTYSFITSVELSQEGYAGMFQFNDAASVKEIGKIDVQNLRTLTKDLINHGIKLSPETFIPVDLR